MMASGLFGGKSGLKMTDEVVYTGAVSATGSIVSSTKGRVRGGFIRSVDSAGSVVLSDGWDSSGDEIATFYTPANADGYEFTIPGLGAPFSSGVYASLTNVSGVTVYYAKDGRVASVQRHTRLAGTLPAVTSSIRAYYNSAVVGATLPSLAVGVNADVDIQGTLAGDLPALAASLSATTS